MNQYKKVLSIFAHEKGFPYILNIPKIKKYENSICFLLIGSVAKGICGPNSDVDIALLCEDNVFSIISEGERWKSGRPSEVKIDGIQLHFYAEKVGDVVNNLRNLNDIALYNYTNVEVLRDDYDLYARFIKDINANNADVMKERLEGKLDFLIRRIYVLKSILKTNADPYSIIKIYVEVVSLFLKVIALLDNINFDPRKNLYKTSLSVYFGSSVKSEIDKIINGIGQAPYRDKESAILRLDNLLNIVSKNALDKGYKVGLEKVDYRAEEK
ncbi:MAG: hypothetical protein JW903_09730 [Clostridia bacterium]|nr:hypothetical protein [Clostridia bacterium]